MKIAQVDSWVAGSLHIVRVVDDSGRAGLGQSSCWAHPQAVDVLVRDFREYLLGKDSRRIEDHWYHMYRMSTFRGAVLGAAVSAIDIALWDLNARRLDAPVYELLGGPVRQKVRLHYLVVDWSDPDELLRQARTAMADGFTAFKFTSLGSGYQDLALPALVEHVRSLVSAVRAEIGTDADMLVELHRSLTPQQARAVCAALVEWRPLFVEDALQMDSITAQADLAASVPVPVAQGERLHSIWEFRELLERGGSQYVRADVGLAGGISHVRKIAALAEAYDSALELHIFAGPVVTAASAHVEVATPNVGTHEWWPAVDEPGAIPALVSAIRREGGWLIAPETSGLGVTFDETLLQPLPRPHSVDSLPHRIDGSLAAQ